MTGKTRVQSLVESYQKFKKCCWIPSCLALSLIRQGSRVKWSNPGNGKASSPTPQCNSYRKGSLRVILNYGCQFFLFRYIWQLFLNLHHFLEPGDHYIAYHDVIRDPTTTRHMVTHVHFNDFLRNTTGLNLLFLLIDWLPNQMLKNQVSSTHSWLGENRWVHTFTQNISVNWNENSLVRIWTQITNFIFYERFLLHEACL